MKEHKVLVHNRKEALELERKCYYGGIVETAYLGEVPTDVYELDVCSMYPSVCRHDLPVKIKGYSERMGIRRVIEIAKEFLVFADVDIVDTQVAYPVRLKDGTYYPIGTYRTQLAHPELMDAISRGVVKRVHAVSWYTKAPIFREYMEWFVKHKIAYHASGQDAFENACKLYATNLYGKTGQLTPIWREWGRDSLRELEVKYGLPEDTLEHYYRKPPDTYLPGTPIKLEELPEPIETRGDYGILEIRIGESESRDSCPAIAACVTSYARIYLRQLQNIAGYGHWYYSDTDSIWTDFAGKCNLVNSGYVREGQLGYLDEKKHYDRMCIYGPKDYETESVCKRKGIRLTAKPVGTNGFMQLAFPGALEQIRSGLDNGVMVSRVTKHLHRNITRCVKLPSGWTRPLVFPLENPERINRRVRNAMA